VSGELDRRLAALVEAVELAEGRLEDERVEPARAVVRRAGQRLGLGVEETVVALAGPTGSGKSSLFNALAGAELADAGRRRPTTASAAAAVWGDDAGALLDWLDVRRRHRVAADGADGLVLLDLPDFDSVEQGHRVEVERLIELVDLLVWVVDPQKYADAALHERYLRRLAAYGGAMLVVLNQADLLSPGALEACRSDLRRVLGDDGLAGVPMLAVSARAGDGLAELRRILRDRVEERGAAVARLAADVTTVAGALGEGCSGDLAGRVRRADRERLASALAEAAGVATVVSAVDRAHRRRAALATGWPFVRWLRRLRPDPLRRLRLADRPEPATRTSLAGPSRVQQAQVAAASRTLAAGAARELPAPWPALARSAAIAAEDEVAEQLDRAVAGADLHMRRPLWWRAAGALQALLAAATVLGAVWLLALAVLGYLRLDDVVPVPEVGDLALPTALLLGGALAGILLSLLAGIVNGLAARRRARAAGRSLRKQVDEVGGELVIRPVEAELEAYERFCRAVEQALER
jgi:GTP-binding protein EngB required for normal cell division